MSKKPERTEVPLPPHRATSAMALDEAYDYNVNNDIWTATKLEWSTTPPTEPGWYWLRRGPGLRWRAVRLAFDEDFRGVMMVHERGRCMTLENITGEWWPVPIEEPGR